MIYWSKPVRTLAGDNVKIVSYTGQPNYPVVGYILKDDQWILTDWTMEGKNLKDEWSTSSDLVNV